MATPEQAMIVDMGEVMTVIRPETETVSYGFASEAVGTPFEITAIWQPNTARRIEHSIDGQRGRDMWAIWSLDEILNDDQIDDPDTGETYVLQQVEYWKFGQFWRGLTMRRDYSINPAESRA